MKSRLLPVTILAMSALASSTLLAVDPPDSKVNPQSGNIEIADPTWSGFSYDINYVINDRGSAESHSIASNALDDRAPRMAIAANGDAWVVWWRDDSTDQVFVRERDYSTGTWSAERTVGQTGESGQSPFVVHDGVDAWVAYEIASSGDTDIAVGVITDDPEPISRNIVASTGNTGARDVRLHAESGKLWVTWIESSDRVGWSEYDATGDVWAFADYELYVNDSVEQARARIQDTVLGN